MKVVPISRVCFSACSQRTHAEEKVIESIPPGHHLHSITTNYSPCGKCVQRILDRFANLPIDSRPVIQFPWVYNYPRTSANLIGICRLAQRGFKIKLWETVKVLQYLIEQAPNPMLRQKLKEAIFRTTVALIERDMRTQRLIKANCEDFSESSSSESDSDEESEDDEEPYCRDWGNSRRYDDDDDEPGAGGAATGGGGGGAYSSSSWFSSSSSSDTNRRTSSQRQGTTAQHSSGWSFNWVDLTATVVLAPWLILLAWSVIRKLYRLFKVSTKMKYSQHFYLQKLFY